MLVTVQNFSDDTAQARLTASQGSRQVAEATTTLTARKRMSVSLPVPEDLEGWVDLTLQGGQDALAIDNHARILLRRASDLPVAVVSEHPTFQRFVSDWISACEGIHLTTTPADQDTAHLVITDGVPPDDPSIVGVLQFLPSSSTARVVPAHWMVASDHPISSYLNPVDVVSASLNPATTMIPSGEPVVWGLLGGQQIPLAVAGDENGRRWAWIAVDPVTSPASTSLLVVFFNSLRWLMGPSDMIRVGEPLVVSSLPRGMVAIHRPDGSVEHLAHEGGPFHYDATSRAGTYRITQGTMERIWVANFLDPVESNLMDRVSTWRPVSVESSSEAPRPRRTPHPLSGSLVLCVLALLLAEWWLYSAKRY